MIFLATLFFRPDKIYVVASSVFQMENSLCICMQMPVIATHFQILATLYTFESAAGHCSVLQLWVQQRLHFAVWGALGTVPFSITAYLCTFKVIVPLNFGCTIVVHALVAQVYVALFQTVCALVYRGGKKTESDAFLAQICVSCAMTPVLLFNGFFISEADAPVYWRWAFFVSPEQYSFTSALRINLEGYTSKACDEADAREQLTCLTQSSGDAVLTQYEYTDVDVGRNILVLLAMWVFLSLWGLLVLYADAYDFSFRDLFGHVCGRRGAARERRAPSTATEEKSKALQSAISGIRFSIPERRTSEIELDVEDDHELSVSERKVSVHAGMQPGSPMRANV